MSGMTTELTCLVWISGLTALMWIPYVLDRFAVWGVIDTVGYPEHPKALAPWAERAKKAHANAVENLVVFAALVLAAHVAGVHNAAIAGAAVVYLLDRVAHWAGYLLALPWLRTVAFLVGWAWQVVIAWEVLL